MKVNMTTTNGVVLKTKNKICKEDITVGLGDKDVSAIIPSNIKQGVEILGVTGTMEAAGTAYIYVDENGSLVLAGSNIKVNEQNSLVLG